MTEIKATEALIAKDLLFRQSHYGEWIDGPLGSGEVRLWPHPKLRMRAARAWRMTAEALTRQEDSRTEFVRKDAFRSVVAGRSRLVCIAVAWAALILGPTILVLLDQAASRRAAIEQQAGILAHAFAGAIDTKLAIAEALLTGLATSRALEAGDLSRFRAQALETAKPPGSWIVLLDTEGHERISTLSADETSKPQPSDVTRPEAAAIAATRRPGIFDPSTAPPAALGSVGLGIPVLRDGEVSAILAVMMAGKSLTKIVDQLYLPAGWCGAIRDRTGAVISGAAQSDCTVDPSSFFAEAPSKVSGWTAVVAVPGREVAAPMRRALAVVGGGGSLLLLAAIGMVFLFKARVDQAFRQSVEASEGRFRMMADTVPSIIYTTDPNGRCEYVNQRFYEYTGMKPGAALGRGWTDALHPDDRPRVLRKLAQPPDAGDFRLNEVRFRAKDGSYRWFLGRARAVREPGGILKWFGSSTDIDDLKQSDAAVRRTNEHLSAVLSSIEECYYTVDRQWRITFVNPKAARFFGQSAENLVGRSLWEVTPDLIDDDVKAQFLRALREHVPIHLEHQTAREPERWLTTHCYPWADGLSTFFTDITRRKSAELAVQRTQELLHRTMDAMSARIAILDEKGVIIAANAAWRRFVDDARVAGAGCDVGCNYVTACTAAIPDVHQGQQALRALRAVLGGQRQAALVYYARPTKHGLRWYQMRATRFGEGYARRVVVDHEDITEIKRAETELREMTGRLLRLQDDERRHMARELHDSTAQNLAAVLMDLDRLPRTIPGISEISQEIVDESRALVDRALQEIRTLSHLLHPPLLDELGLPPVLRWLVRGFENRSGVTVSLFVQDDLGRMPPAVESALFRVVQEALTNIHRHSGSATAEIRLTRSSDLVSLQIRDQGRGMPVDPICNGAEPGLVGVGISGMRARLHQLGGELEIRSTSGGTTVAATISLSGAGATSAADGFASRCLAE